MCPPQNRKAQRGKWVWWKDELQVLNHIAVEKTVIYSKWKYMHSIQLEKLRLILEREVRDGYVLGVSS